MAAQKQQPNGSRRKYKLIITLAETKLITKQTKLACSIHSHTLFKVNMPNIYTIHSLSSSFHPLYSYFSPLFSKHLSINLMVDLRYNYSSQAISVVAIKSKTSLYFIAIIIRLLALTAFTTLATLAALTPTPRSLSLL